MSKTSKKNISRKYRLKRKTLKRRYSTKKRYRASSQRGGSILHTVLNATKDVANIVGNTRLGQATLKVINTGVATAENRLIAKAEQLSKLFSTFNGLIFKSSKLEANSIEDKTTTINFNSENRTLILNGKVTINLCDTNARISSKNLTLTKEKNTFTRSGILGLGWNSETIRTNYHGFCISYRANKTDTELYLWMTDSGKIENLRVQIDEILKECVALQQPQLQQPQQQQWQPQQPQQQQQPQQHQWQPHQQQWQPPQLPSGWSMRIDPYSGRPYYVNNSTGQSSWELPSQ